MAVARSVGGSTFSNDGREWHLEILFNKVAGPGGIISYLHQQVVSDPWIKSGPSGDNHAIYGKVRGGWPPQSIPAMPEQGFHIRFYDQAQVHSPLAESNPEGWADRVGSMLREGKYGFFTGYDGDGNATHTMRAVDLTTDPFVIISAYNETNLEYGINRGIKPDAAFYKEWAERELRFFKRLDQLFPNRKCQWAASAPTPGHDAYPDDPDSEYAVIEATGLYKYVDLVQLHTYAERHLYPESGPSGRDRYWYALRILRPVGWRDQAEPGKPHDRGGVISQFGSRYRYFIGEWNDFFCNQHALTPLVIEDHAGMMGYFAACPYIVGATSFIWLSGGAHKQNVIADNEELRDWYEHDQTPLVTTAKWPLARWNWTAQPQPTPIPTTTPAPKPPPGDAYVIGDGFRRALSTLGSKPVMHEQPTTSSIPFAHLFDNQGNLLLWVPGMGARVHRPSSLGPGLPLDPLPPPTTTPAPLPVPATLELDGVPHHWSQLGDFNSDADQTDENARNNCGPTCLSIVIYRTTGYNEAADSIKDRIKGDAYVGNLFVNPDLSFYLQTKANIPVTVYHEGVAHDIRAIVEQAIRNDFPVCVLYKYAAGVGGALVNHFSVAFGYTGDAVILANPWKGERQVVKWVDFLKDYLGWALVCRRGRDPFLRQAQPSIMQNLDDIPVGGAAGQVPSLPTKEA